MPELPEVQTVVDTLWPRLSGRRVRRVVHLRDDMLSPQGLDFAAKVTGHTIVHIARLAKRIHFTLDNHNAFFIHLGMTGRLTLEPITSAPRPHTHLRLDLESGQELRFCDPRRFGQIRWLGADSADVNDGPEPLTMRSRSLARNLARTRRAIKTALLDQRVIAGLGNIYADESLFDAGIHPLSPSNELTPPQVRRLTRSIKKILRRAIAHKGSSIRDYVDGNGQSGGFQHLHRVYARAGQPCPKCGTAIERLVIGGRSSCFCPECQRREHHGKTRRHKKR